MFEAVLKFECKNKKGIPLPVKPWSSLYKSEICLILENDIVLSDALCGVFNCKLDRRDLLKLDERISISLIYL